MSYKTDHFSVTHDWAPAWRAWTVLALVWAGLSGLSLLPGALLITHFWTDALHLVDILARLSIGHQPHADFVTPIGRMAFEPIAALMRAGLPTGQAYVVAQILLGGTLATATLALCLRRMPPPLALGVALMVLVIAMGLIHGRHEGGLSINVHYNRWCWALGFVAVLGALLPPKPSETRVWDGIFIGIALALMALIKVTYFAAFAPVAAFALLRTGQTRALIAALITGLAAAAACTALWGTQFWAGYIHDILYVARSEARPQPPAIQAMAALLGQPAMLPLCALGPLALSLLWHEGLRIEAALFTCLLLAGLYVSSQNAGHDPFFLGLAAVLLLAWMPSVTARQQMRGMILVAGFAVMAAPNFLNLALSPARAALTNRGLYVPLIVNSDQHQDILVHFSSAAMAGKTSVMAEGYRRFQGIDLPPPPLFRGAPVAPCQTMMAPHALASIAADLADQDLAQGHSIFVVDYISAHWLFGDHPPLEGGAPWSYGGLHGLENADFVLVPHCAGRASVNALILAELDDIPLTEIARRPLYALYAR